MRAPDAARLRLPFWSAVAVPSAPRLRFELPTAAAVEAALRSTPKQSVASPKSASLSPPPRCSTLPLPLRLPLPRVLLLLELLELLLLLLDELFEALLPVPLPPRSACECSINDARCGRRCSAAISAGASRMAAIGTRPSLRAALVLADAEEEDDDEALSDAESDEEDAAAAASASKFDTAPAGKKEADGKSEYARTATAAVLRAAVRCPRCIEFTASDCGAVVF